MVSDVINDLDASDFKNNAAQNWFTNKINMALAKIGSEEYADAEAILDGILKKTDGCFNSGNADNNDKLETCEAQDEVHPVIVDVIAQLQLLL